MDQVDAFVLLDNVQYKKNEFQNRNRIKTPQGLQWLTVPVSYKFPGLINEVTVRAGDPWRRKHQQTLVANYAKAPYWAEFSDSLRDLYAVELSRDNNQSMLIHALFFSWCI
ncbi:MAG: WbqC family protein [Candidatus Latescibacterota bacterium]